MNALTMKLVEALQGARHGLRWYHDTYPEVHSPADDEMQEEIEDALRAALEPPAPIDMILQCPKCHTPHIDGPEASIMAMDGAMHGGDWPKRWTNPPHRTHLCHHCHNLWRPAMVPTNGVKELK